MSDNRQLPAEYVRGLEEFTRMVVALCEPMDPPADDPLGTVPVLKEVLLREGRRALGDTSGDSGKCQRRGFDHEVNRAGRCVWCGALTDGTIERENGA